MKYWLGVVSKEHVLKAVEQNIAQVCHGKRGPLARMSKGDYIIYYSPKISMGGNEPCKCFTAIGRIRTGEVYQFEMSPTFKPYRLDVDFLPCEEVPLADLSDQLTFKRSLLRFGLLELDESDFRTIATALEADID